VVVVDVVVLVVVDGVVTGVVTTGVLLRNFWRSAFAVPSKRVCGLARSASTSAFSSGVHFCSAFAAVMICFASAVETALFLSAVAIFSPTRLIGIWQAPGGAN
jgi:hypothetical protein